MIVKEYLMISALRKQLEALKAQTEKEKKAFNFKYPYLVIASNTCKSKDEPEKYAIKFVLSEDITKEVLSYVHKLTIMRNDEIYTNVLNKLLAESKHLLENGK